MINHLKMIRMAVIALILLGSTINVWAQNTIIEDGTRARMSLDGTWQAIGVKGIIPQYPAPDTNADWKPIDVPHKSASPFIVTQGHGPYSNAAVKSVIDRKGNYLRDTGAAAWFKRNFIAPDAKSIYQRRAVLYLHGAAFRSDVYLNGKHIGTSVQGLVPNQYDVTDVLKPGQENQLLIGLADRDALVDPATRTLIAPCSGVTAGLWGRVELQFLPAVHIEDVFVQTFVENKKIALELTLSNHSKTVQSIMPLAVVLDDQQVSRCNLNAKSVTLKAGEKTTIRLQQDWLADNLWSPDMPYLYTVKVQLKHQDNVIDDMQTSFGFREFTIKGTDFYLNGRKTRLLRNSMLTGLNADEHQAWFGDIRGGSLREAAGRPYNTIRLHLGFNNEHLIDAADQIGLMVVPESSWYHVSEYPAAASDKYLPNLIDYFQRWVKLHRNHPSIVMWSLTNEHFWGRTGDEEMAIGKAVAQTVLKIDPTRPIQGDAEVTWNGVLPVINIHYPEGTAGDVRNEFPNSSLVIPNDLYWLKKGKLNTQAWRAEFVWDRPLVIGEYWDYSQDPDKMTSYVGDTIYDWQRWRYDRIKTSPDSPYIDTLRKATDVYRLQGVAGLNPWSGDRDDVMPRRGVRALDFHPNFFAGQTTSRTMVVFNETSNVLNYAHLQCRLIVDGNTIWEKKVNVNGSPDLVQKVDVPIEMPMVNENTKATLTIRLLAWAGGAYHQMGERHRESVFIMPRTDLKPLDSKEIVLLDNEGLTTTQALATMGMDVKSVKKISQDTLTNARLLIVGRHTNPTAFRDDIVAYVKAGGRLIVLPQESAFSLTTGLPEPDAKHVASRVWERTSQHPIVQSFDGEQFSYWRPDHITSKFNFTKMSVGGLRYLLDCGGLAGMDWSPLVEAPLGSGTMLLCQMRVIDGLNDEPMAGALLEAMIQYALQYKAPTHHPLRLLANSDAVVQVLKGAGVAYTKQLQGEGTILVDASYELMPEDIGEINSTLARGGNVWLHGFDKTNVNTLRDVLGFEPVMIERDKTVLTAALTGDDPLLGGLANFDFFWAKIRSGAREDYFQGASATAPIGGLDVLQLPALETGTPLCTPALMIKIPRESGTIFFDGISWDKAYATQPTRVCRIVGTLAMNLGATIELTPQREFKYFPISLAKHANRAYFDPEAGDGQGGWTDQGPDNDMSFFLINHTGKFNGMDVTTVKFPVSQNFADRPFQLIDPASNQNKAVLTFRGREHDPKALKRVDGIAVNKKAHMLWFLQTACWANNTHDVGKPVLQYVINYSDGSKTTFDQRVGIEIAEWWDPTNLPAAKVAWSGRNNKHSPIGIFVTAWENPFPEKSITNIDAIGGLGNAQVVLLAITAGMESGSTNAMKLISQWDMSQFANGQVNNIVPDAGAIQSKSQSQPTLVQIEGQNCLRFRNGQRLDGNTKQIPALAKGGPMRLETTLAVEEITPGYCGGIFQSMVYGKKGFRLVIDRQMKLSVEIYFEDQPAKYLKGKTPLQLGRMYDISVDFDGQYAKLMIDDRFDALIQSPPPSAYTGPLQIGVASGKDYFFNGVIKKMSLYTLNQ